ncbi:MAG: hypothetical protein Q9222_002767 [Ikaeria aurantiellina]
MVNNTDANSIPTHPHNYYNSPPSTAWHATVADSVGLGLVTLVIIARCYTKFLITKAPGWEDSKVALEFIHRFDYGGGRHSYDLPPEYYQGFLITNVINTYLYIIGVTLAKISLLLFLYRIFRVDRNFRIASWVIGAVLTIWSIISLLLKIFACRPVKASFVLKLYIAPTTHCPIKSYDVTNIHGLCNIITDFAILILPIPMVWNLHVNARKKIGLAAVFATGILYVPIRSLLRVQNFANIFLISICAVAIVRQSGVRLPPCHPLSPNYPAARDTFPQANILFSSSKESIEFSFSIIVASLPTLTPLIKKLSILSSWIPTLRSKITRSNSSKGVKISGPVQDHDIERNALKTPIARKGAEKNESWDDYTEDADDGGTTMRSESDVTLQDLQPVDGSGVGGKRRDEAVGLRDFVNGEIYPGKGG